MLIDRLPYHIPKYKRHGKPKSKYHDNQRRAGAIADPRGRHPYADSIEYTPFLLLGHQWG